MSPRNGPGRKRSWSRSKTWCSRLSALGCGGRPLWRWTNGSCGRAGAVSVAVLLRLRGLWFLLHWKMLLCRELRGPVRRELRGPVRRALRGPVRRALWGPVRRALRGPVRRELEHQERLRPAADFFLGDLPRRAAVLQVPLFPAVGHFRSYQDHQHCQRRHPPRERPPPPPRRSRYRSSFACCPSSPRRISSTTSNSWTPTIASSSIFC